jgi:G3E family GTPase
MRVKVDIISGFLGAGKTTLIKKLILEEYTNEKVVVIENEFGKVNIDGEVLKNSGIIVQEITAGCICCSHEGDLIESIEEVVEKFNPDRIIVEPTGVARLSEVLASCRDSKYSELIEVNCVITVVDVKRFRLSVSYSKEFIDNQIKATKSILFSKTTGVKDEAVQEVIDYIRKINPHANIVNVDWNQVSAREIINAVEKKASLIEDKKRSLGKIVSGRIHQSNLEHQFSTWEFESNSSFSCEKIKNIFHILSNELEYGNIIRGKGILKNAGGKSLKFDFVSGDLTFEEYDFQDTGKVCVIGTNLEKDKIMELFG